ncbi:hypothetical protein TNCV_1859351 [Trichonephila clavipes]|nr:hypothetical protein TNCV_1859351 [Trichonephila clavipes]
MGRTSFRIEFFLGALKARAASIKTAVLSLFFQIAPDYAGSAIKKQDQKTVVDPIIPTNNSFASLVLDDAADPQDESPMVEDVSGKPRAMERKLRRGRNRPHPKIKPIMLNRYLKCSKEHRTGECQLKNAWIPPLYQCDADGHTANWRSCPAFPKIKTKGAATENRNKVAQKPSPQKKGKCEPIIRKCRFQQPADGTPIEKSEPAKNSSSKSDSNKRRKTPLPKDLSRQWPNFANFSRTFRAS